MRPQQCDLVCKFVGTGLETAMHAQRGEYLAEQLRCALLTPRGRFGNDKNPLLLVGCAGNGVVGIVSAVTSGSECAAERRVAGSTASEKESPEGGPDLAVEGCLAHVRILPHAYGSTEERRSSAARTLI